MVYNKDEKILKKELIVAVYQTEEGLLIIQDSEAKLSLLDAKEIIEKITTSSSKQTKVVLN